MPQIIDEPLVTPVKVNKDEPKDKLDRFRLDMISDAQLMEDTRDKANEDFRFIYAVGGMWEGFIEKQFSRRVKLQFDITTPYKNRFIAEYNLNRIGVEFKSDDSATNDEDAELLTGIRNADFRQFSGKISQDNAVEEVAVCGYGCYQIATQFEDEEDPENENQRIVYRPIFNAYNSIFWDNAAKRIDKSDARRCTWLQEFTRSSFQDAFPDADPVSAFVPNNRRFQNFNSGGGGKGTSIIYVATRYDIVRKKVPIFVYQNLEADPNNPQKIRPLETFTEEEHELVKKELKDAKFMKLVRKRMMIKQHVEKTVFSGEKILKETVRIPGKWIPIIPMYAYRGYVDGMEWYSGFVRPLKDPQRMFNMQISQLAENAGSSGQEIPIFDPEQMIGPIKAQWADKNNKNYLLAHALREDGKIVHSGPIGYLKPQQLDQSTAQLIQIVSDYLTQATGGAPQDTLDPDASGKAIQALLKRENLNTQPVMDHIANSVEWEGTVYASIAAEIYNTPRLMRTLGKDGNEGTKRLLQLVLDEESGKLVESNSIEGKKFRVYADIGPQYETLREQKVEELKGMLEALRDTPAGQKYTPAIIAALLSDIDGPGMDPIRKLANDDMILMGIKKPETEEEKQLLANAQQQAGQPEAQDQALQSLAAEAEANAREADSKSIVNVATAGKTEAQTQEILSGIERDDFDSILKLREQTIKQVEALPLN